MQFLFPAFLTALGLLAIPIIVHLYNFRRYKKVQFSNVSLLKNLIQASNSRRRLQEILVLLCRCLAILFLVLAFAQPFLETRGKVDQKINHNSIYIDNSFSMSSTGNNGILLESAKSAAAEIISGYNSSDKFQIITNDMDGGQFQWITKADALNRLNGISISPASIAMSQVVKRQQQSFQYEPAVSKNIYLISDFQRSATDLHKIKDTTTKIYLIQLQSDSRVNVSIDTAFFLSPVNKLGTKAKMLYRLNNSGTSRANVKPVFTLDNQSKALGLKDIKPGEVINDTVEFALNKKGWQVADIKINDFPITFDDTYYFSWNIPESINIMVINDHNTNQYLNSAINASNTFNLSQQELDRVNYSNFKSNKLIILNELKSTSSGLIEELKKYLDQGGNLLIFPSQNVSATETLSNGLKLGIGQLEREKKQVFSINTKESIFENVFEGRVDKMKLPISQINFRINVKSTKGSQVLLSYRDGYPYLVQYQRNNGQVFVCAAPMNVESSDLATNGEILVPLIYNAAIYAGPNQKIAYTISSNEIIALDLPNQGQDAILKFNGPQTFIPEQFKSNGKTMITIGDQNILAGNYKLVNKNGSDLGSYAFNYDRKESDLKFMSIDDLNKLPKDQFTIFDKKDQAHLAGIVSETETGKLLWKYCLIATLLFLLSEILLLRFFRR